MIVTALLIGLVIAAPPTDLAELEPQVIPLRAEWVEGLPPGARFEPTTGAIHFRPDSIQGGRSWPVSVTAGGVTRTHVIRVADTVSPPAPELVEVHEEGSWRRLVLSQKTDPWLDARGRAFAAVVEVPSSASDARPAPVRVELHGFSGEPWAGDPGGEIRVRPSDPDNTYWWGYSTGGTLEPYTARRVLHLLEWVLKTQPADPERVTIAGGSMGGAGAATIGLLHARHFAAVEATIAQAIPRNHRPFRKEQLAKLWGAPAPAWDDIDLTRVLLQEPEARDQWIFLRHAKDDRIIHFGAVVHHSPLTGRSFYQALQDTRAGCFAVWDEGGHGPWDPILGPGWWGTGWHRILDPVTFLRRDRAFPAFSQSSANDDPGDGTANGKQPWDDGSGYSGDVDIPDDTGWSGDRYGAINRWLRWDARRIVDQADQLHLPLRIHPSYRGPLPITVDVTPRRTQRFRPAGPVRWTLGPLEGTVEADADGSVTVPQLPLTMAWSVLVLERSQASSSPHLRE